MVQRGRDTGNIKIPFKCHRFKFSGAFLYCFDFQAVSFECGFALVKVWGFGRYWPRNSWNAGNMRN